MTPLQTSQRGPLKRQSIVAAALLVFAHDGYSRASIDAIASRAATSTRTIYKYFPTKQDLFRAVIELSSARIAERHLALIRDHLSPSAAPAEGLTAFARAIVGLGDADGADEWKVHEALLRHLNADLENLPEDLVNTWLDTGPRPVAAALAARLQHWADTGELTLADPDLAAELFGRLITPRALPGGRPTDLEDRERWVSAAIDVFLHGYSPTGKPAHQGAAGCRDVPGREHSP
jgi:AcrR family transcriptional regulator